MSTREERAAAARSRIQQIATRFFERTGAETASLRASYARLAIGETAALADLRQVVHRLCGTGASLGFIVFADRAQDLEQLCDAHRADPQIEPTTLAKFGVALDALVDELERLRRLKSR